MTGARGRLPTGAVARIAGLVVAAALGLAGCGGEAPDGGGESDAAALARMYEESGGDLIDLTGAGYDLGETDAPLSVVELADFGCGYCRQFAEETFPMVREEFIATGKVRWKFVPFVLGMFPNGAEAARAGECAGAQDAFFPMHDRLFATQDAWKGSDDPLEEVFLGEAAAVGLDTAAFRRCYEEGLRDARTREANALARRLSVRSTPTFFIEGFPVQGAIPEATFRRVLDQLHREKTSAGDGGARSSEGTPR